MGKTDFSKDLLAICFNVMLVLIGASWSCRDINNKNDETEVIPYEKLSGKMAFSRTPGKIIIIDANNKNTSSITPKDNAVIWEASVSLSPDGKRVAYAAYHYTYDGYQIFTMSVSGGSYKQLTEFGQNSFPIWNADGTRIFFNEGGAYLGNAIFSIMPSGENKLRITEFYAWVGRISVSKDGNFMIGNFSKSEFGGPASGISLCNIQKNSLKQITSNDGTLTAYSPVFSPDEKKIAFVLRHGPNEPGAAPYFFKIMTVKTDGSDEKMVIELPFAEYNDNTYVTWSPDGTKLAYNYGSEMNGDKGSHIFTVNPDGTGLAQITFKTDIDGAPSWIE